MSSACVVSMRKEPLSVNQNRSYHRPREIKGHAVNDLFHFLYSAALFVPDRAHTFKVMFIQVILEQSLQS